MRNLAIDQVHAGAGPRACSWCLAIAAALVLAPVTASAGAPSPDAEQPTQEPDAEQPDAEQPTSEPAFEPVDIPASPPEPAPPPEPEPAPPPEPIAAPIEGPLESEAPSPEQRAKIQAQRKAGMGVMAAGGVLSGIGLGMTLTFTILGDAAQGVENPVLEDIERNDSVARVGGILIASGVAFAAIGGIVLRNAERKAKQGSAVARIRVMPALGGLVLSGQF